MRASCRPTAVLPEPMGPMRNILPLPNIKYAQHTNLVLESSAPLWGGVRQNANPVGSRSGPVLQFGLEQAAAVPYGLVGPGGAVVCELKSAANPGNQRTAEVLLCVPVTVAVAVNLTAT